MIKNIVFDFGGVLLDLRPDRCIAAFTKLGIPEMSSLITFAHQQGVLDEIERGVITLDEFCDGMRALHKGPFMGMTPSNRQIVQAYTEMADGVPAYKLDFCRALQKEGYHVSLLSNTNIIHWNFCRRDYLAAGYVPEELFEYVWLSCEKHLVKPDPRYFQLILDESGYKPEETLFVDDNAKNCEVARSLGIQTFCASIRTDWTSELRAYLTV